MKLGQYQRIMAIKNEDGSSEQEKAMRIICVLNDIQPNDIRKLPFNKVERMMTAAQEELTALESGDVEIKDIYTINGKEYRLMRTVNMMTAIQFSDIINVIREGQNEIDKYMHIMLSILLVPVGCYYPDYNRHALEEEIMEHFEVADAKAISAFCRGLFIVSSQGILTSLMLTEARAWMGVPKWRRVLARKILMAIFKPSQKLLAKNGAL